MSQKRRKEKKEKGTPPAKSLVLVGSKANKGVEMPDEQGQGSEQGTAMIVTILLLYGVHLCSRCINTN